MRPGGSVPEHLEAAAWELWTEGRRPCMRMAGTSMQPLIADGDELVIETTPATIRFGDVAVYRSRGRWIAHRVVAVSRSGVVVCKGDRALRFDPPVPRERIRGRVLVQRTAAGERDYGSRRWRLVNVLAAAAAIAAGTLLRAV